MHIVVTGASGFVGPRVISEFACAGHTGCAVARREIKDLPRGWTWLVREQALRPAAFLAESKRKPDWVVHLEVKQHVDSPAEKDRQDFQTVNVDGTRQWLDWCSSLDVEGFAYFSTIKAVGEASGSQDEAAATAPTTPYGESKRKAEEIVALWAEQREERRALILRPAVIYGPGNRANVFSMVRAIDHGVFFFVGRNENVKSLVAVANVAAAVMHLLNRAKPGAAVYNLVDRESFSVRKIAEMVARELGGRRCIRSLPHSLARIAAEAGEMLRRATGRSFLLTRSRLKALDETTHFSCVKLLESGFVHPQSTQEGMREMVEWYRAVKSR